MIGISVQDLGVVLSIMGATMSCLVILLLPGIFYYRLAMKSLSSGSAASSSSSSGAAATAGKRSTGSSSSSYAPVSLMLPSHSHHHIHHHQQWTSYLSSTMQRVQDYLEEGVELLHRRSSFVTTAAAGTQSSARDTSPTATVSPLSHVSVSHQQQQQQQHHTDMDDLVTISFHGSSTHPETPSLSTDHHHHHLYEETENMTRVSEDVMPGMRWKRYAALMFFGLGVVVLVMSLTSVLFLSSSKGASSSH